MKQGIKSWLQKQMECQIKKPFPVLSYPAVTLLGVTVRELVSDAKIQAQAMETVAQHCDTMASVSLMDLSLEAECFGAKVRFSDDEVPNVTGTLISSPADVNALTVPGIDTCRAPIYIEAVRRAAAAIGDRPVFAGMIGPFSLAARLFGVTEIIYACMDEPETIAALTEKCTEFLIKYASAYKNETGAAGIIMAEPVTGLLPPDLAEEFSEPFVRKINEAVADDDFIIIYHNCGGSASKMIDSLVRTGCAAFHFGNAVSMPEVLAAMPENIPALGNIDPSGVFRTGSKDDVRNAVESMMNECGNYRNFIPSSGCDIPPLTPWENIDEFFTATARYYENPKI